MADKPTDQPLVPGDDDRRPNAEPGMPAEPKRVNSLDLLSFDDLEAQMRWAIYQKAIQLAASGTPQEASQLSEAILRVSQAVVILDPDLVAPNGVSADALRPPTPMIPKDKQGQSASRALVDR